MITVGLHGLDWHRSRLIYIRETVDSDDLLVEVRLNLASRIINNEPPSDPNIIQLDDLILELLRLKGEMDTAAIAKALAMNQKTAHRHLAGLEWHGIVEFRRQRQKFLWTRREEAP